MLETKLGMNYERRTNRRQDTFEEQYPQRYQREGNEYRMSDYEEQRDKGAKGIRTQGTRHKAQGTRQKSTRHKSTRHKSTRHKSTRHKTKDSGRRIGMIVLSL
jgi:hypothetical protein